MELIRLILLKEEGQEAVDLTKYSEDTQVYHYAQLVDAGLLRGHVTHDVTGTAVRVIPLDLTWAGHDFLAAARSKGMWTKATEKLRSVGVDVPMSVMKELLIHYSKQALDISDKP